MIEVVLDNEVQCNPMEESTGDRIPTIVIHNNIPIEIEPGKTLNTNSSLTSSH